MNKCELLKKSKELSIKIRDVTKRIFEEESEFFINKKLIELLKFELNELEKEQTDLVGCYHYQILDVETLVNVIATVMERLNKENE